MGPFTNEKLTGLFRSGDISQDSQFRQGTMGSWLTYQQAENKLGRFGTESLPSTEEPSVTEREHRKWSTEPLRHQVLPLQGPQEAINRCQHHERLLLSDQGDRLAIVVTRSDGTAIGKLTMESSSRIYSNSDRGSTHVCLLDRSTSTPRVAVVECPPGTTAATCQEYISQNFPAK